MAVLDVEHNAVVIRIVYDGPPEAGKTTSLRALAASLSRPMTTPAAAGERTLYFDWLEYTGGLFEGHQIRCQLVTVPGQTELAARRRALLASADVVVFVSDSTPHAVEETRVAMREMREVLSGVDGPPVGVIVQANKRDRDGAVPIDVLRAAMPEEGVAVLESVATSGRGVRETFVFAVRLALDRVRELLRDRALPLGAPAEETSDELLSVLRRVDAAGTHAAAAVSEAVAVVPVRAEVPANGSAVPRPPDHEVPAGLIWPPVDGRVLLLDACAAPFVPRESAYGDWIGEARGWRFQSPAQATFADAELGRRALIEWARLHAAGQRWLSSPRVVVLAHDGAAAWRLWQIVRVEPSVRDMRPADGTEAQRPARLLRRLLDAGRTLLSAAELLPLAPCRLPITIDTVGAGNGGPLYVGLLPDPFLARGSRPISASDRPVLLRRELSALASIELQGFDPATFPPLATVTRESDSPAVIDAVQDVLVDAGVVSAGIEA